MHLQLLPFHLQPLLLGDVAGNAQQLDDLAFRIPKGHSVGFKPDVSGTYTFLVSTPNAISDVIGSPAAGGAAPSFEEFMAMMGGNPAEA